jgi:hypothetical protein
MTYSSARDLEKRIEEIDDELSQWDEKETNDALMAGDGDGIKALREEKLELEETLDQIGRDATLLVDSGLVHYAQDTAEGMSGVDLDQWPFNCIDWERAAEALQSDMTTIEIDGETYYVS